MKFIIGFNGKARSGKDSAASYLVDNYLFDQLSFATPIKKEMEFFYGKISDEDKEVPRIISVRRDHIHGMAKSFGFTKRVGEFYDKFKEEFLSFKVGETDATFEYSISYRRFAQLLGTNVARSMDENVWVDHLLKQLNDKDSVVISDVRFDNEAKAIIDNGGVVIRINRDVAEELVQEDTAQHVSEGGISEEYVSAVLGNNGTLEELYQGLEKELDRLFEERTSPNKEGL